MTWSGKKRGRKARPSDGAVQESIVFDDGADVADRVELSGSGNEGRLSPSARIIVPVAEDDRTAAREEVSDTEAELEEDAASFEFAEERGPKAGFTLPSPRVLLTILALLILLAGGYGYFHGAPSFMERWLAGGGAFSRNILHSIRGTAVITLEPFFLPGGEGGGRSGLVFLEMVVDGSLLRDVETRLPAVRGVIYLALRNRPRGGSLSKEELRVLPQRVNSHLGFDAVIEVRAGRSSG